LDVLATSRYDGFVEYASIYNDDEHVNPIAGNVEIEFSDDVMNVIRRHV
jgi:hypothetical protein